MVTMREREDARIKVVIAIENPLMRQDYSWALSSEADLEVVGQAETGRELMRLIERVYANIVVVDLNLKELDGVEVTWLISRLYPRIRIIVLSSAKNEQERLEALGAGAAAYLTDDAQTLIRTIRNILTGNGENGSLVGSN